MSHPSKDVPEFSGAFEKHPWIFQSCPKTSQSLLETSHSLLELPRNRSELLVDFPGRSRVFWRRPEPFQSVSQVTYSAFWKLPRTSQILAELSRDVPEASRRFQKCIRAFQRRLRSLRILSEKSHTVPEISQSVRGAGRSTKVVSWMFAGAAG